MWLTPPQWDVSPRRKASEPVRVKSKSYRDAQAGANQATAITKREIQVSRPQPVESAAPAKEATTKVTTKDRSAINAEAKQTANHYFSQKNASIDRETMHMDFLAKLKKANPQDFAMIHGCGGNGYAANSTITIKITDTSGGTGNSVKVQYSLDVHRVSSLKAVVEAALAGLPIGSIYGEKKPGDIFWSYKDEKNNSYAIDERTNLVPVAKIEINYCPFYVSDEGILVSNYPWYIRIENFKAPAKKQKNGQISHISSQACYKRTLSMNVSSWELSDSLDAVLSFIHLWELRSAPLVDEMCTKIERDQETYRKAKAAEKEQF